MRFSVVVTCSGRLAHLQKSLPRLLTEPWHEVVVVDYDCKEGTAKWVEASYQDVKTVKAFDPLGFNLARARNCGALKTTGDWLCFVDADTLVSPGWLGWLVHKTSSGAYKYFVAGDRSNKDATGILVCPRFAFALVGGYDEAIRGWGGEDIDLRMRLDLNGFLQCGFPMKYVQSIPHSDIMRDAVDRLSIEQLESRAALYVQAKRAVSLQRGGMRQCCRESLLKHLSTKVGEQPALKAKLYYPLRFFRYCESCAASFSFNEEMTLHRVRECFTGRKSFKLVGRSA